MEINLPFFLKKGTDTRFFSLAFSIFLICNPLNKHLIKETE